jgi:hypothetical protein
VTCGTRAPAALLLVAVLHFVADDEGPWSMVKCLTDHLAPGSYLVISHVTSDDLPAEAVQRAGEIYNGALVRGAARSGAEIGRFFHGTSLIDPGLVNVTEWRKQRRQETGEPALFLAGIGRKPAEDEGEHLD